MLLLLESHCRSVVCFCAGLTFFAKLFVLEWARTRKSKTSVKNVAQEIR